MGVTRTRNTEGAHAASTKDRDLVEYDGEREAWLERQGFTVVRFSNAEILSELHAVQRRILATLSRPGGRGPG
jgi:very-short-patch-repair endonuclease